MSDGVETKALNQAVRRNKERFPDDFMFQLTKQETDRWAEQLSRSQSVTLKRGQNIKYAPLYRYPLNPYEFSASLHCSGAAQSLTRSTL